jgi:hypothetical protein
MEMTMCLKGSAFLMPARVANVGKLGHLVARSVVSHGKLERKVVIQRHVGDATILLSGLGIETIC